jgi:hypothetical protein
LITGHDRVQHLLGGHLFIGRESLGLRRDGRRRGHGNREAAMAITNLRAAVSHGLHLRQQQQP